MKKSLLISLALCGILHTARANDQMRNWTLATGEKQQAEILGYDEEKKIVTLRYPDQSEVKMDESAFSTLDRAWILEWIEQVEEAQELLKKIGGTVSEHVGTGKIAVHYAVYQPATAAPDTKPPMLILFHPGGNGRRQIYRYVEAASSVGMTVVSLEYFRNTSDSEFSSQMFSVFQELLPQIEATVPHDPNRIFMGGVSGGALRAYLYSAKIPRPWAGIFANGGWLGGSKNYNLAYPKMRVAMLNGDKDNAANHYLNPDTAALQKAGCTVSVHAFEGGHQLAPPSVQAKAMRWLLGEDEQ